MYGRRAYQLLNELAISEKGQLAQFNNNDFDHVIKECKEHYTNLESLLKKNADENLGTEITRKEDHFGATIHHLSITRNKRCLMAYVYNRGEIIQNLRWKIGRELPQEIQEKISLSEKEYFKSHSAAIESYMSELDLDLTLDMVPPKDPYVRVRVLSDIGEVCLDDHEISLTQNSLHFIKRTDAEPFISQGLMEEFLE